jgi:lysophospholipase L1-like esterase
LLLVVPALSKPKLIPLEAALKRIVFLGDSITDGNSYPALIRQALMEVGYEAPTCINAGIGGHRASQMRARLDRDVLAHTPSLVCVNAGVNDSFNVPPAAYEADIDGIAERLVKEKVACILVTPSIIAADKKAAEANIIAYSAAMHRVAAKYGLKVAEVYAQMNEARGKGETLLEVDGIHPNFAGHRAIARAILDTMGFTTVPVLAELQLDVMPGIIATWQMRALPDNTPLTEATVAAVKPDAAWKPLTLPMAPVPDEHWWWASERKRGFALNIDKVVGKGRLYQGYAVLTERKAKQVYLNTGSELLSVWVNGKKVNKGDNMWGWHAGRERIAVQLQKGDNVIVIESGANFFLSVTDNNTW